MKKGSTQSQPKANKAYSIRNAIPNDLDALCSLEDQAFELDRISRRSFRRFLKGSQSILCIAENSAKELLGYGLVLLLKGTRLARLYSLAVSEKSRGMGLGKALLIHMENCAVEHKRIYMRLEVAANNLVPLQMYLSLGYQRFGLIEDYYENHETAIRLQKQIRHAKVSSASRLVPWYQQTTPFTCGPAALMMAMNSFKKKPFEMTQNMELSLWRESTTIYMTSGHGGCHPVGLALAALARGFKTEVIINTKSALFVEGVRDTEKKSVLRMVDLQFKQEAQHKGIPIYYKDLSIAELEESFNKGMAIVILVSSFRFDGKKAPHWVTLSATDEDCFYVHDPDPIDDHGEMDSRYIPIAKRDFEAMSFYGGKRLRTAVILHPPETKK